MWAAHTAGRVRIALHYGVRCPLPAHAATREATRSLREHENVDTRLRLARPQRLGERAAAAAADLPHNERTVHGALSLAQCV